MSKADLTLYFLQVEDQYLEMLGNLKEFEDLMAENKISQEEYEQAVKGIESIKDNYDRIGYVMFLLNKPKRKGKQLDKKTLEWYKALSHASKEAILDENKDALCTLKSLLGKAKEDKNEQ